jgi:hypothetical protein
MNDESAAPRLSGEQILALKFAAHRQLARWANKPKLSPHQHGQRSALKSAVRVLRDESVAHGCELRIPDAEGDVDA